MTDGNTQLPILMAEDDDDDFMLIEKAFKEAQLAFSLKRVKDGEELMDYLCQRGAYADAACCPMPLFILLDLNMPRKDGREALRDIKTDPRLRKIPVIVLTTSESEDDITRAYELGVNSFIRKPVSFEQLVEVVSLLKRYWLEIVTLPEEH